MSEFDRLKAQKEVIEEHEQLFTRKSVIAKLAEEAEEEGAQAAAAWLRKYLETHGT